MAPTDRADLVQSDSEADTGFGKSWRVCGSGPAIAVVCYGSFFVWDRGLALICIDEFRLSALLRRAFARSFIARLLKPWSGSLSASSSRMLRGPNLAGRKWSACGVAIV